MSAAKIRVGCFKCGTGKEQYVDLNSVIHKCPLCKNENNLAELLMDQNYGKKQEITHLKKLLKQADPAIEFANCFSPDSYKKLLEEVEKLK